MPGLPLPLAAAFALAAAWLVTPVIAETSPCPAALEAASRLVLVTTKGMDKASATLETFERASVQTPWERRSSPEPAVVGKTGLGWGLTFRDKAQGKEPLKREGDGRAPAGIFAIGAPFGFEASSLPGYIELKDGVQICVDDPASPFYSQIVTRAEAGPDAKGEDMPAIELYRRGLVVDYPTSGKERGGSCIFIHIWRGEDQGTVGCVAAPEATVAGLQEWAGKGGAAIAILPQNARERFAGCLP